MSLVVDLDAVPADRAIVPDPTIVLGAFGARLDARYFTHLVRAPNVVVPAGVFHTEIRRAVTAAAATHSLAPHMVTNVIHDSLALATRAYDIEQTVVVTNAVTLAAAASSPLGYLSAVYAALAEVVDGVWWTTADVVEPDVAAALDVDVFIPPAEPPTDE